MRPSILFVALLMSALTPALAHAGDIRVEAPVMRATIGRSPATAAYMTLVNEGATPDRLVSARCDCAGMVMVHRTEVTNGMAMMGDAVVIVPAHGSVAFRPGDLHLMLMRLSKPLLNGAEQPVVLVFEHAGEVKAAFKVKTQIVGGAGEAAMPMGGMPGMH
jgi:copper(I)-binding protein